MDIAIIPARSGSKRIKNKNIRSFKKKPLIYYSIKAAQKSKLFKDIFVSTDCKKIAKIAQKYGAKVPFLRPKKLSDDFTSTQSVIRHFLKKIENKKLFKNVCCIYATAPFIDHLDLIKANKLLKTKKNTFIFTAAKFQSSIYRSFFLKNNKLQKVFPDFIRYRSQDLKDTYFDAGQFYFAKYETWMKKEIFSKNSKMIIVPFLKGFDLNTKEDLKIINKIKKII